MRRRIAINGFGRIGRLTFRGIFERHADELDVVAINDPAGSHTDSLLLEYDSPSHYLRRLPQDAWLTGQNPAPVQRSLR